MLEAIVQVFWLLFVLTAVFYLLATLIWTQSGYSHWYWKCAKKQEIARLQAALREERATAAYYKAEYEKLVKGDKQCP